MLLRLPAPFTSLVTSWSLHLRTEDKSPATVRSYIGGVRVFATWLAGDATLPQPDGWDGVTRDHCRLWLAQMIEGGAARDTRRSRHGAVDRFFDWCVAEGEVAVNPMLGITMPSPASQPVNIVTDEQMRTWIKQFAPGTFLDIRDEAIVRLFLDCGLRLSELSNLAMADLDLPVREVSVLGEGSKPRTLAFSHHTTRSLDRYLRRRTKHTYAHLPALWVGRTGSVSKEGVYAMIVRRSVRAGIGPIHPHQFRHTFAHTWMAAGGSEGDLMANGGWQSHAMLQRYGKSMAAERARDAHRRLALGDRI